MPPNQFAYVTSRTPGVFLMCSKWLYGIEKISDVERIVTVRVEELAAAAALNASSTEYSVANRNTAIDTLSSVSAVRRLLRVAVLRRSVANFMIVSLG